MENSTNEKLIGALLLGAAIGGILGVLFAPDKGSETRKKLPESLRNLQILSKKNLMLFWKK
jgi:gas vesicle protein